MARRGGSGLLSGDIDGDDNRDRVTIRLAPSARASCGFFLVVETRRKTFAERLPQSYKPPQDLPVREWPWPEPYVALIVRLSPVGSQVVVARWHGASVAGVSLHGIVDGRLKQLAFSPKENSDELTLYGSLGTGVTSVRCRSGRPLTVLGKGPASASGTRWRFDRTDYRLIAGRFVRFSKRTTVAPEADVAKVSRRWRLDVEPFTGCAVARGRRL